MITFCLIVIGVLIIVGCLLGYLLFIQVNKLNMLEKYTKHYSNILNLIHTKTIELYQNSEFIEAKHLFEKDDEVGSLFDQLTTLIKMYTDFLTIITDQENATKE